LALSNEVLLLFTVFLTELVDTPTRINNLLSAGIKRMALRAHVNVQISAYGRVGFEGVTATASNVDGLVIGMYFGFHCLTNLSERISELISVSVEPPGQWIQSIISGPGKKRLILLDSRRRNKCRATQQ
jgi:hypothetical protein